MMGERGRLIRNFVDLARPLFKVLNGLRLVDVNARNETFEMRFGYFFINKLVSKVDGIGIVLCVGIVDARHSGPI